METNAHKTADTILFSRTSFYLFIIPPRSEALKIETLHLLATTSR